ncbi:MAG: cytochrome P460 family protein [Armatimonadetes bacterium]|nr:cytochrome P460 family protein [Armatimonadota bacterium]
MKAIVCAGAVAAAFVAWTETSGSEARLDAIKGYRSWKQATTGPQDMTPAMALSCVGPRPQDQSPNPHNRKVFMVYVNAAGAKVMMDRGKKTFPDGTVIVKEKYDRKALERKDAAMWDPVDTSKVKGLKPELLTVMAKKNGRWTYYAVDAAGKVMNGDVSACIKCHDTVKGEDYVFRPYVADTRYVRTKRG